MWRPSWSTRVAYVSTVGGGAELCEDGGLNNQPIKRLRMAGTSRDKFATHRDYTIGWICALSIEMSAAKSMLDEVHDILPGKEGDSNTYILGNIGNHNIVIACLPAGHYGTNNAAIVARNMCRSFPSIDKGLMVGIGGGVPDFADVRLGDVVVSLEVVQHDLGKVIFDGTFQSIGIPTRPPQNLLTAVAKLRADHDVGTSQIPSILVDMLDRHSSMAKYSHPGVHDQLFHSTHSHVEFMETCETCNTEQLVQRTPRENNHPKIHYGRIASGNQVIKDGKTRAKLAKQLDIICFEMEAAGLMDQFPCLIVRGICDYSDSHKNKAWQPYAAAVAAAYAKELLLTIPATPISNTSSTLTAPQGHLVMPFGRNEGFIGREDLLQGLLGRISPTANIDNCQRTALEGLGGIGKTQVAIEAAYRIHEQDPSCSIFWVPAVNSNTFEHAYREIGRLLKVEGITKEGAHVTKLVQEALSSPDSGHWLMIIDNADDPKLLFGQDGFMKYLPSGGHGSILFTTRNHEVPVRLDIHQQGIHQVSRMTEKEAKDMLNLKLTASQTRDVKNTNALLRSLDNLPLAIKQASAYMAKTGITPQKYLQHCQSSNSNMIKLLGKDFEDCGRYDMIQNPVTATWLISFEHISRDHPLAGQLLRFMSFLVERDIPSSILPPVDELELDEALGVLKSYDFISEQDKKNKQNEQIRFFDMHRLVRLATRNWLDQNGELEQEYAHTVDNLAQYIILPDNRYDNSPIIELQHLQSVLDFSHEGGDIKSRGYLAYVVAESLDIMGKKTEAEYGYRLILALSEAELGKEHPDTMHVIHSLGFNLQMQDRYDEAEQLARQAVELRTKVLGAEHDDTLYSMNTLAAILSRQEKHEEADRINRQVLEVTVRGGSENDGQIIHRKASLATSLREQGSFEEAEALSEEALLLAQQVFGKSHLEAINQMRNLAVIMLAWEKPEKVQAAEPLLRQALVLARKTLGKEDRVSINILEFLGNCLSLQGKAAEAEQCHRFALKLNEKAFGPDHDDTILSAANLEEILEQQGKSKQAHQIRERYLGG